MHVHVCLSSPILWAGWLRQAVREVGLSWACQCGRVGLMRRSSRRNKGFTGNRKRKKTIQVSSRDGNIKLEMRDFVRLFKTSIEIEIMTDR